MSRARHKKHHEHERAAGGKVVAYSGGESNVMKEAHERKRGGRVHHGEGEEGKHHAGKRKRGGKVEAMGHGHHQSAHHEAGHHGHHHRKHGGKVEHDEHGHEHEHKKRARGGAVGSDKRPLSSAANTKKLPEEKGGGHGAGPANEQTDH